MSLWVVPVGLLSARCRRTKWQSHPSEGRGAKSRLHRPSDEEREVHELMGGHATCGFQEDALGPYVTTGHVDSTHRAHQAGLRAGLRGAVLVGAPATRYHRLGGLLTLNLREKAWVAC